MPNKDITNSGLINPNIQLGNIMLNNDDQKVILTKYKEMFGEPTSDEASVQKMNSVVKSYYDYKKSKLEKSADEEIAKANTSNPLAQFKQFTSPAYQNAVQFKRGIPKSSISSDAPGISEPIQKPAAPVAKKKTAALTPESPEETEVADGYKLINKEGEEMSMTPIGALLGMISPKKKAEANIIAGEYAEGMGNFLGDLFSGKIGNFFMPRGITEIPKVTQRLKEQEAMKKKGISPEKWQPTSPEYQKLNRGASYFSPVAFAASGGKSWMSTPESRDKVFHAFSEIGKGLNEQYSLNEEQLKEKGISPTLNEGLKITGGLLQFLTPGVGEELMAAKFAPYFQNANRIQRIGGTAISMLPNMVPKIHASSIARGEEMGLKGQELNDYANKNTLANTFVYATIPNFLANKMTAKGAQAYTKLITEPARQGAIPFVKDVIKRAAMSGVAGSVAAGAEQAITNPYLPEEQQVDVFSKEGAGNMALAFATNAIVHTAMESKGIYNSFKSKNKRYAGMVYDMAKDYDNSIKLLQDEYEKSRKTPADAQKLNTAVSVLAKIKPYVNTALGIPENLKGVYAFEMAKLEDLVNKRNKIAPEKLEEIKAVNKQIDAAQYNIDQLAAGNYKKGELINPLEVIKMADQNTPGRLNPIQVLKMASEEHFGFKSDFVDPKLFEKDPEVQYYLSEMKNGTMEVDPKLNTLPIVVGADGKIIDGKKRVAKVLFDIEKGTYPLQDAEGNKIEAFRPITDSEIADNINDLSTLSDGRYTHAYLNEKRMALTPEMKKQYGLKETDGEDGITIGHAINQVYHNTKQKAFDRALGDNKVTIDDVLSESITGEIDGMKAEDKVKNVLAEIADETEARKQEILQDFVDRVNQQNTANVNANIPAFKAAVEFLQRAGMPADVIPRMVADALGIERQYVDGFIKKLRKDGKIKTFDEKDLFANTETKLRREKVAKAKAKKATEKPVTKVKATVTEVQPEPEIKEPTRVADALDNMVEYEGKKGRLFKDEENNIVFDDGKKERIIGKTTDPTFSNTTIEDAGIKILSPVEKGVTVEGNIAKVDGQTQEILSINKNTDGEVVSYTYKTQDGKVRTSRNIDVAEEIATQQAMAEIESQEFTPEQKAEAEQIVSDEFKQEYSGEAERVLDEMPEEVVDTFANMMQGLKKIAPDDLQQMVVKASEWVEKAKERIDRSKAPEAEKKKVNRMLDLFDNELNKYYEKLEKQRLSKTNAPTKAKAAKSAGQNKPSAEGKPEPTAEPTTVVEAEVTPVTEEKPINLGETVGKEVTLADGKVGVVVEWSGGEGVTVRLPEGEGSKLYKGTDIVSVSDIVKPMEAEPQPITVDESDTATQEMEFGTTDDDLYQMGELVDTNPPSIELSDKEVKLRYNEILAKGNQESLKSLFDDLASLKDENGLPLFERDPNNPKECP